MADDADDGWISSAMAVDLTVRRTGRPLKAEILRRARDGILKARAAHYIESGPKRGQYGETNGREEKQFIDCELPKEFFWAGSGDALEADWTTGSFSTWIDRTRDCRAFGVQFLKSEIVALAPVVSRPTAEAGALGAIPKHSQAELEAWIRAAPLVSADKALGFLKLDPRYNGIKQDQFRPLWGLIKKTKRGNQPKPKS